MKIVIQRVSWSKVIVDKKIVSQIKQGILLLVGIEEKDNQENLLNEIVSKILKLRIFSDQNDKMNLSIEEIKGEILVVSQFTLLADTTQGNRPYYGNAAGPEIAKPIFNKLVEELKKSKLKVETGIFGAKMEVELLNDGPVTILPVCLLKYPTLDIL